MWTFSTTVKNLPSSMPPRENARSVNYTKCFDFQVNSKYNGPLCKHAKFVTMASAAAIGKCLDNILAFLLGFGKYYNNCFNFFH